MSEIQSDLELELKSKKKIPQKLKEKIYNKIFINTIIAIIIVIYFGFLNLGYNNIEKEVFITDLKVFSFAILALSIILLEKGYKKDNAGIFLNGIETFCISFITLFMTHTFFESSIFVREIVSLSFLYIAIYYMLKSVIVYIKEIKNYKNNISDVRDIIGK